MSLSNHGAWQCVTSVVIVYNDQRGSKLPLLLEFCMHRSAELASYWTPSGHDSNIGTVKYVNEVSISACDLFFLGT